MPGWEVIPWGSSSDDDAGLAVAAAAADDDAAAAADDGDGAVVAAAADCGARGRAPRWRTRSDSEWCMSTGFRSTPRPS